MRNIILPLALVVTLAALTPDAQAAPPEAPAQTVPVPEASDVDEETNTLDAAEPASDADSGGDDSDALHGGGPSNTNPRGTSLQEAMRACEGLSGSASARCQERALADHPGEF